MNIRNQIKHFLQAVRWVTKQF